MKHASYLVIFSACVLLVMACNNASDTGMAGNDTTQRDTAMDASQAKSQIKDKVDKFVADFERGDSNAVAAQYASDAWVMPPNSERLRGNDIASFWGGAIRMGVTDMNLNTDDLVGSGNWMTETGTYEMYGADKKVIDKGKYVVTWKREDGDWKIYRDIWNTNMSDTASQ
jgi:ketosteroid isomerase-like protein